MKYSDLLAQWLAELGYTHCFFVAGGNVMHLLESLSHRFTLVPVVHEVAAGIAAEYFNEVAEGSRAFALVTAGPGMTNLVTALAGAYLESRELLVIGGQVKVADLARAAVRQRGIQEIDGVAIARPVAVLARRLEAPVGADEWKALVQTGSRGRKGPVFLELPLDVQGRKVDAAQLESAVPALPPAPPAPAAMDLERLRALLRQAERPALLIGGGVRSSVAAAHGPALAAAGIPLLTTWNGADRVAADNPLYFGRPNTWGQRAANLIMQQANLLIVLGSRLGLQQTGFNWQQFVPAGKVVQVDCDPAELAKGHPRLEWGWHADANAVLTALLAHPPGRQWGDWVAYCRSVTAGLPPEDPSNVTAPGYVSPFRFCLQLAECCEPEDLIVPCSSGGAFTVMMQAFRQKAGQRMISNKGLASMGYGLSGAIGAALAGDGRRTVLVEGDGGFSQNLQELGTVAVNRLNLKIFIFNDNGYASIRMTQRNYFGGRYVGCDQRTGLGLPQWEPLFAAYGIPLLKLDAGFADQAAFRALFDAPGPAGFIVPIDPDQTYFPKIASRVTAGGGMESNPLHEMSPPLGEAARAAFGRYLPRAD